MAEISNFKEALKFFSEATTIHGFHQLFHSKSFVIRLIWDCILLAMFSCTIWFCSINVQQYMQFHVKTAETFTVDSEFEFPAITFCNQFPGLRSILATNPSILQSYSTMLTEMPDDIPHTYRESEKICKSNKRSQYENLTTKDLESFTFNDLQQRFTQDSFRSVIKCWWAMKEFDCSGSFANHITDRVLCFSYVPNKMLARFIISSDVNSWFYGANESMINDRIVQSGTKSGLQLLLNLHQEEHCDACRKYEGAGFQVMVHDPLNVFPTFSMSSHINLHPGYIQTVTLKPTVFTRKTDHLRLCKKPIYDGVNKKIYFKNLCVQVCFLRRIAMICNCAARQYFARYDILMQNVANLDINSLKNCTHKELICVKNQQVATYMSENFQKNCPECIQPCYETNYEFLVFQQKFSDRSLVNDFQFLPNKTNRLEIQKNFLLANFIFDSLTVIRVVETQEFTIYDVFIYFGGVIGLFLGMSFLSIGDIFQLVAFNITLVLKVKEPRIKLATKSVLLWVQSRMKKKTKVVPFSAHS